MSFSESGFELLSAETAEFTDRSRWRPEQRREKIKPIRLSFPEARPGNFARSGSHVSVILGRNGQGKSRLLSAIASSLQLIQTYNRTRPMKHFPLRKLTYVVNSQYHEIDAAYDRAPQLRIDGELRDLSEATLPTKVIALSMTPFDKFPFGSRPRQLDLFELERPDIYSYFGMRDRMGRASVSALLFRVVDELFTRVDRGDRARIAKVFDLIGYEPFIEVVFRVDALTRLSEIVRGAKVERDIDDSYTVNRVINYIKGNEDGADRLLEAAENITNLVDDRFALVRLDVQRPSAQAERQFSYLQLLRQLGFARLYAVEVKTVKGSLIDFKQASSGELSIAISFLALASSLQDGALVLIDEPETNLHPEWQAKYIDLLTSTFSDFANCQYILATHSPLILSDAPQSASLASVSDEVPRTGTEVSGQSVDYLLAKAFQTVGGANYYLQDQVIKALRIAADGDVGTHEFIEIVSELARLKPLIRDNPGIVEVIGNLENIARRKGRAK